MYNQWTIARQEQSHNICTWTKSRRISTKRVPSVFRNLFVPIPFRECSSRYVRKASLERIRKPVSSAFSDTQTPFVARIRFFSSYLSIFFRLTLSYHFIVIKSLYHLYAHGGRANTLNASHTLYAPCIGERST